MAMRSRIATTFFIGEGLLLAIVLILITGISTRNDEQLAQRAQASASSLLAIGGATVMSGRNIDLVQAKLEQLSADTDIDVVLISDLQGRILAASDPARIGQSLSSNAQGSMDDQDDNVQPIHTVPIVGDQDILGILQVTYSHDALQHAYWSSIGLAILIMIAASILNLGFCLILGRVLTRGLADLADTAADIAAGNTAARVILPGHDEVARLGQSLNSIVDRLETNVRKLRSARDRLIKPTEAMSEGFALWDSKDRLLLYNQQFCKIFAPIECSIRTGMRFSFFARLINDCLLVEDRDLDTSAWVKSFIDSHQTPRGTREVRLHSGRWISVYEFKTPEGEVIGIYADITERKLREHALKHGEQKLRVIMNSVVDGIVTVTGDSRIRTCNEAAIRMFGHDETALLGLRLDELINGMAEIEQPGLLSIRGLATLPRDHIVELSGKRADGAFFPIEVSVTEIDLQGQPTFIATVRDITSRKASEEMIRYQATHDALTDLPNRSMFDERLSNALELAARSGEMLGVMFLDLDRFKMVNDSLGHSVGDALLVGLGHRLRANIQKADIVGRMGGDEFILILRHLTCREDAAERAHRILDGIRPPFYLEGHELHVTASIGISVFPEDGRTSEQLLKMADLALYRAKGAGRNRLQLFNPTMDTSVQEQIHLETELRRALEQEQFQLVYQPQIDIGSGRLVGVEALIRWHHPEMGTISPQNFIPLAEETGLIQDLGLWVLRTACNQHRYWREAGLDPLRMAVNLSGRQLENSGFDADLEAIFRDTGMVLSCLELELTETVLMQAGESVELLKSLASSGVSIALDDFGTGYSSLSYLRRFPIDRIKIDQSFVSEIDTNSNDGTIARAIIGMAHGLDIQVVAEGVETGAQLDLLKRYGCDEAQGFLLSQPVAGEKIPGLSKRRRGPNARPLQAAGAS